MKKFLLFTFFFIFLAGVGWGQAEFKWTGTAGDDAWNNLGNWVDENDLPVISYPGDGRVDDIVVIEIDIPPSGVQLAGDIIIKNLTISNNSDVIIDTDSYDITITNALTFDGKITINSGGGNISLNVINGEGDLELDTGSGNITINGNITTTGDQNYGSGDITLAGTRTLTSTDGSIAADGKVTGAGITVNASQGISLVNAANELSGTITLNNTQTGNTPAGNIDFTNDYPSIVLSAANNSINGEIIIDQTGNLSIASLKTDTSGSIIIVAAGNVTQTGAIETDNLTVLAGTGVTLETPAVNKVITSANLTSAAGNINFTNDSAGKLIVKAEALNGDITIAETTGALEIDEIIASGKNVSLKAAGNVTQTAVINADSLTVETDAGITLDEDNAANTVSLESKAAVSAQGNIIYKNDAGAANTLEVTVVTPGNVTITETTGALYVNDITSGVDINLKAKTNLETRQIINVSGAVKPEADGNIIISGEIAFSGAINTANTVTLKAGGNINVNANITAYQLTTEAAGNVNVGAVRLETTSAGNENTSAAIYIKADDFNVSSTAVIVPGGTGGQLCLDLNNRWDDTNNVVDGIENVRWHQHFINLTGMHLVYGTVPPGFSLSPSAYVHIPANDVKTTFTLGYGFNVYINDAVNTNPSGISFITDAGFIEFSGINKFEKITLESGSAGIHLVDTDITITGDFKLTHSEEITLNSPPGTGSSIKAANITLNVITEVNNENLTLTTTSGEIILNGNVGAVLDYLGDITIVSADKVTFSEDLFSKNLNVTSVGAIILNDDINTEETQTYNGQVELGGTGNRILTGTTVTLGPITGNTRSLTIDGDAVLNGGSGISDLVVNRTSSITADITTTGNQTYSGAVTLGGTGKRTLQGTTVTLGNIAGAGLSLAITGNAVLNGGSGIVDLTVSGTAAINADITTTGNQTYTGAVTLGGDVNFTGNTVRFSNTVNGLASERELTITGANVIFDGTVGSTLFIKSVNVTVGTANINANITTNTGNQTYSGAVTLGGGAGTRILTGQTITLGAVTGAGVSLTITGDAVLNGGNGINVFTVSGDAAINADITTTGNQTYTGDIILSGSGKRTISSQNGSIEFQKALNSVNIIELLATGGDITIGGKIEAYQLIAKAAGKVTVSEIEIDSSNTGNEGINAAIYIEADTLDVKTTTPDTIVPGGKPGGGARWGQLCLVLNNEWTDDNDVVDGLEDIDPLDLTLTGFRWHQHKTVSLAGMDLVYGTTVPSGLTLGTYVHIQANDVKTTFTIDLNKNIYINDAVNADTSGLTFKTSGTGFIEFGGTNIIEKITLESGSGGIRLVDTDITITGGFELIHNETITLITNSPPGTGINSIKAANINLNNITAEDRESLTLTTTSGEINFNGTVGTTGKYIGDIAVNSADKVTFLGILYADSISVTSAGTTNIDANITTTGTQTYTGAVTLGGASPRTLQGTTVTLGTITGAGLSLAITGNGVLNGGSGINVLTVSGTAAINADITTAGNQTYTGVVTLGGNVELDGTTVTLGLITGNAHSLAITGNGVLNGGSGINVLTVSGTVAINADITTTGNQTYTGAVTLGGSGKRTITSNNGSIEFQNTLNSTNSIELSAVNITIAGNTTALQLTAKAANGTVSVNAVTINSSSTGNEGASAAIYIEADTFVVTTTAPGTIVPGGKPGGGARWGQLCLVLNNKWTDDDGVVDGPEDVDPLNLTLTGFRWHQHLPPVNILGKILYSFTEDSSGNGRLDRIRVQTSVELYGNFYDFDVSVEEYEIDRTQGVNGFVKASEKTHKTPFDDDSFYIYLIEKPEIDGKNTPLWSITKNTSLTNKAGSIVGDPEVDINLKPIDTIPPRIAYTLTLPGHPQTYMQVTEPVVSSSGAVSAVFGGLSVSSINQVEPADLGYLFNLSGSYKIEDLALLPNIYNDAASTAGNGYFRMDNIFDKEPEPNWSAVDPAFPPKYPLNWGYTEYAKVTNKTSNAQTSTGTIPFASVFTPPNKLLTVDMMSKLAGNKGDLVTPNSDPVIRRVTDVLVSMTPEKTNSDNYFAWPVWARFKKSLNAAYSTGEDVFWGQQSTDTGIIWQFDGTNYLETSFIDTNDGIELQARINDNLTEAPVLFWTTADIPVEYRNPKEATEAKKTGGLWLPNVLTNPLYNYVLMSDGINGKPADGSSSRLFVYNIANDILVVDNNAKFEFIFRLSGFSDMFIARLDIPRGAVIPDNWYTLVRPFVFDIRNIRRQRGGVTILNNVINSNNRETAFIRYHLTRPGRVTVQIYTLDGTLVKSLRRGEQREAGEWTDSWDGTNNGGRAVARGMYFVKVVGPDIDEIRKIMVVK